MEDPWFSEGDYGDCSCMQSFDNIVLDESDVWDAPELPSLPSPSDIPIGGYAGVDEDYESYGVEEWSPDGDWEQGSYYLEHNDQPEVEDENRYEAQDESQENITGETQHESQEMNSYGMDGNEWNEEDGERIFQSPEKDSNHTEEDAPDSSLEKRLPWGECDLLNHPRASRLYCFYYGVRCDFSDRACSNKQPSERW